MADIINELRNALAALSGATFGPDYLPTDDMLPTLKSAGGIYASATREVNERLFKCEQLLSAGQRSEALRQATLDPDLLKRFAELDIPVRVAWGEFAGRNGLPAPAALNKTAAAVLNQAFAAERAVEPLLQQYRTLALTRAPMQKRLDALRLLVRAEPVNIVWIDDLARFEAARCEEIRGLANRVRQKRDWELATQLAEEVRSPNWANKPPLDVVDAVLRARDELLRLEAQRRLTVLAGRMRDAIRTNDLAAAEAVQADVLQVMKDFGLAEADPLLDTHRDAFAWVQAENKKLKRVRSFQKAVHALYQALRDGHDWWYVRQCYQQASSYDLPIDEDVLVAYHRAERQRVMLRQAVLAGGAALVMVVVVVYLIVRPG